MASSMDSSGSDSGSSSSLKPPTIDRLSDLPDPLICHILSFLPTKMVVATSILATRWKSLWTKVTSFEVSFVQVCSYDPDVRSEMGTRFAQIVNKVLLLQKSERLDKLHLSWDISSEQEAHYVNIWASYAVARNLRSCSLCLGPEMFVVNLPVPDTLFTCKTLESLHLSSYLTLQVPTSVCLPKLQVLKLYGLLGSDESIQKLISGCPVLHSLTIFRNGKFGIDLKISSFTLRRLEVYNYNEPDGVPVYDKKLEIDAPNLEFLDLEVYCNDCSIKCPSASLNTASLELGKNSIADSYAAFVNGMYNDRCNSTVKLFETLNRAKCLRIRKDAMMAISRATIPLSTRFERLTELDIWVPCCEWSSLSVMLGCCNRLQSFRISAFGSCDDTHKRCWKDPEQVPECLLSSLARVSFPMFRGLEDEISLVRYFLKHASVLESIAVTVSADPSTSHKKFQMLQAISEFPRLSSACSLEFA